MVLHSKILILIFNLIELIRGRVGTEMAQWLRVFMVVTGDPDSVSIAHRAAHNFLQLQVQWF